MDEIGAAGVAPRGRFIESRGDSTPPSSTLVEVPSSDNRSTRNFREILTLSLELNRRAEVSARSCWSTRLAIAAVLLAVLGLLLPAPAASGATLSLSPISALHEPDVGHGQLLHNKPLTCMGRVIYAGRQYCRATVENIEATALGLGQPAFLGQAIVSDVGVDDVGVAQQRGPICDEGTCDFYLVFVRVRWAGVHRPQPGSMVNLYGTTVQGSLAVTTYELEGFCEDPYGWSC